MSWTRRALRAPSSLPGECIARAQARGAHRTHAEITPNPRCWFDLQYPLREAAAGQMDL